MAQLSITPRRIAPYVISGATGVHILVRMHRLSRQPAIEMPLYFFLLKNSDVVLALSGASVVIWQLAKHKPHQARLIASNGASAHTTNTSLISGVVHELRQIFTSLLLGLGLIKRKAMAGNTQAIPNLVQRLNAVVRRGMDAVNKLEPSDSSNGQELSLGDSA